MDKNGRVKNSRAFDRFRKSFIGSITGENHPSWGKKTPCTESRRINISKAKKGRPNGREGSKFPKETRERMSMARIGMKFSDSHRKALSEAHKGKVCGVRGKVSAETRKKISNSLIGQYRRALTWIVTFPDGSTEVVFNLERFRRDKGIPRFSKGRSAGYTALKASSCI